MAMVVPVMSTGTRDTESPAISDTCERTGESDLMSIVHKWKSRRRRRGPRSQLYNQQVRNTKARTGHIYFRPGNGTDAR